jgi:DNA-binding CsgD family transcriptional regulator
MSKSEDTPANLPIPERIIADVALEHAVSESTLTDILARIHNDLVEGADAIQQYYRSEYTAPSISAADGLVEVIFAPTEMWKQLPTDLTDEMRAAAKAVHAAFAKPLVTSEEGFSTADPLVMPSAEIGELTRAGLSPRQAEVQILRNAGLTQAEIGDRLGVATNTVKVHCHRIDTKVANAKQLVALVET